MIKAFLKENKDVEIIYLPKGSSQFNESEGCWHQVKHALLVSKYYPMFTHMKHTASEYFRTVRFDIDIMEF